MATPAQLGVPYLSPAQRERLAILSEELGEVQQIIGKITRHGYFSSDPNDPDAVANIDLLAMELGDIMAILRLMRVEGELNMSAVEARVRRKLVKLRHYTHYQSEDSFIAAENNL